MGALRRELPALRSGAYERLPARAGVAAFARGTGRGRVVVLANAGRTGASIPGSEVHDWVGGEPRSIETLAYGGSAEASGKNSKARGTRVTLPAQSVTLVRSAS